MTTREKRKIYREKNKDKINMEKRANYQKNKDKINLISKKWRENNKDRVKEYREINREKLRKQDKIRYFQNQKENKSRYKKYYLKNRVALLKKYKENHEKNKDKIKKYMCKYRKTYRIKNKDKIATAGKNYYIKNKNKIYYYMYLRRKNDVEYRILQNMRSRLWMAFKRCGLTKRERTIKLIGCNGRFLKEHIEKQFHEGMTWENYGKNGWHIDHIKPCVTFDLSRKEEQDVCFHYTNLQPLWARDNLSKNSFYNNILVRKEKK